MCSQEEQLADLLKDFQQLSEANNNNRPEQQQQLN